jgi:hypothetical protein
MGFKGHTRLCIQGDREEGGGVAAEDSEQNGGTQLGSGRQAGTPDRARRGALGRG